MKRAVPRALINVLGHMMWTEQRDDPRGTELVARCSCGWSGTSPVTWHDDVVMSQIKWDGHESGYVLAPPIVAPDPDGTQWMTSASVCVVDRNRAKPVSDRALAWLLEQPDLPDEFRRAAAVHLDR